MNYKLKKNGLQYIVLGHEALSHSSKERIHLNKQVKID
jgi:hypothetical protein